MKVEFEVEVGADGGAGRYMVEHALGQHGSWFPLLRERMGGVELLFGLVENVQIDTASFSNLERSSSEFQG